MGGYHGAFYLTRLTLKQRSLNTAHIGVEKLGCRYWLLKAPPDLLTAIYTEILSGLVLDILDSVEDFLFVAVFDALEVIVRHCDRFT